MAVTLAKLEWTPVYPKAGEPVSATCRVVSDDDIEVPVLCIAVRDPFGHRYDFPQPRRMRLTSQGSQYTSGSRAFPVGEFRVFVAYRHPDGRWMSLLSKPMFVSPPDEE